VSMEVSLVATVLS